MIFRPIYSPHHADQLSELAQNPGMTLQDYERRRAEILQSTPDPVEFGREYEEVMTRHHERHARLRATIVDLLQEHGELNTAQVARHLGVKSPYTLQKHLYYLTDSGAIKYRSESPTTGGHKLFWRLMPERANP